MAAQTLILLADTAFQPALLQSLTAQALPNQLGLKAVSDRAALNQAVGESPETVRLVAFCTEVIVPPATLERCAAGAYNFHPGPPEYPGIFPSCFAIYDGATTFGATAHRMTAMVDGGDIVAVSRFDMPPNVDRLHLDGLSFDAVMSLFKETVPRLLDLSTDLSPLGETWTGPARTRKHFEQLCHLPDNVSQEEFERRYRAVGEGPEHALTLEVHGHRFRLDNLREQDSIVRGGQSAE